MLTRQLNLNVGQILTNQRSPALRKFRSFKHDHHLFDTNPHPNAASTNRSMLNFLHTNLPFHALAIFKKRIQMDFFENGDEVTVALALKACRGDLKLGRQIHGFAISSGLASYLTVTNSSMNMYCKAEQFEKALHIFYNLCDRDIVSWNTILSGFRESDEALNFALRMNLTGVVFDTVTYTTVLAFCSDDKHILLGLQLHSLILKFGFGCEVFVGNALISMYSRWEHLTEARRVFDEMSYRDLVSWNAMLSGYTQEGEHGLEASLVFIEMVREGMKLDHVSLTSAVSACGHEKNSRLGRQIHGLSIKTGYGKHVSVCNVLISTYSKCELLEDAKSVFRVMNERNVISWTTMISLSEEAAMSLFIKMRLDGVFPNDVTLIGLIHAIAMRISVEEGRKIHGFCTKTGFLSELNVCNCLITMYSKFESMQDSLKVFRELHYREIISWNALISGYAQNGFCQEALETFLLAITESKANPYTFGSVLSAIGSGKDISIKHGLRCHSYIVKIGLNNNPVVSGALLDMYAKQGNIYESQRVFNEMPEKTQLAWTAIISGHAQHGDYESVMNLFHKMKSEGEKPDSITFLSVLTACGRKGMIDMGRQIFNSMIKDYMIEPLPEHYSCMVDMLGRAGKLEEAEGMLKQIPGGPGLSVLQSLLGSCRIHGNVDMAERVANDLMKMDPSGSGSYVLMSNLYAEKGQWEKVAEVRKGMRKRGVKKEIGFSWVDVGGSLSLYGFSSGDKTHPQSEDICRMAECVGLEMKFLRQNERTCETILHKLEILE